MTTWIVHRTSDIGRQKCLIDGRWSWSSFLMRSYPTSTLDHDKNDDDEDGNDGDVDGFM